MNNLFKKMDKLLDESKYEETVDLFNKASEEEKTPDVVSLTAVAYNNIGDTESLEKAIELLKSIEETCENKFKLYYRLGYSYYHLEAVEHGIEAFLKAKKIYEETNPEDTTNTFHDVQYFLQSLKDYQMINGDAPVADETSAFDKDYPLLAFIDESIATENKDAIDMIRKELREFISILEKGERETDTLQERLNDVLKNIEAISLVHFEEDSEEEQTIIDCVARNVGYITFFYDVELDFPNRDDDDQNINVVMYEEDEMTVVEDYINKAFGKFHDVFHEIVSTDIHCDLCVIEPTKERNYYTITTMGMGALQMTTPEELTEYSRAELCIHLPPTWDIKNDAEKWYWPLRWLKILARLPAENETWLGAFHTIPSGEALADNTHLEGFMLVPPNTINQDEVCTLPNGETVHFFSIIPLHDIEMTYKVENDGEALLEKLQSQDENFYIVDIDRVPCVLEEELSESYVIDAAYSHVNKIFEKELPVESLAGYNHIAAYVRWFAENNLLSEGFLETYPDEINAIIENQEGFDARVFLHEQFNGRLVLVMFNDEGVDFTEFYYDPDNSHCYPKDVDSFAFAHFGGRKEEMKTEEYLFLPWGDEYYQGIKPYIDAAYKEFKKQ